MSDELIELEEEEHTSQLTAPVLRRIVTLLKPHWKWVVGFIITIMLTSIIDAYFTYLNKEIVDTGITLGDRSALRRIAIVYGVFQILQAGFVFTFIYLAGVLGDQGSHLMSEVLTDTSTSTPAIGTSLLSDLENAYNATTPLGWTAGALFNEEDNNSGFGLFFDARGLLFSGGPDGVTVFDTAGNFRLYDNSGFTGVVYDPANDRVLVTGFGDHQGLYPASIFQVSEPSTVVPAGVAMLLVSCARARRRRFQS